ncbi:spore coat protein [Brevibacillus borstelensis]|uniref:spore coat protein n=1 Tax=Brevibacillus borstelensis TaxID=45462 RepID=UPI0004F33717|nr:spore coat protein [Brevibacillus borstelensis]KKX53748.1 spore coat protein [Brevibacillus borstelensis cifa_chp40]
MQRFAAHEFLETQEALRSKHAEIEMHGLFAEMAQDPQLKNMVLNHQRQIMNAYQQGINLLMGKGVNVAATPQLAQIRTTELATVGLNQPQMMAPNPHPTRLSDMTIATIMLNWHKAGSAIGMLWASECVDPQIRQYHVNGANLCQQMAYETWQYMNMRGFYQTPQLADHTMNTMINAYQQQPAMA